MLAQHIQPGITTNELDQLAEAFIRAEGAIPSFKGLYGFPASICASINNELVHGIPSGRKLSEGDIISIDIGAQYQGWHGDSAWTYPVGRVSEEARRLLDVTEQSLYAGLEQAGPNVPLYTISHSIQTYLEKHGLSVVREYAGHGVGRTLHEDPQIPNFGPPGRGPRLLPGMVLAIEPMACIGERYVETLDDDWSVVTVDGSLCAHFEHTIAITEDGIEILTTLEQSAVRTG
jgi:methionyl aminopeptidase